MQNKLQRLALIFAFLLSAELHAQRNPLKGHSLFSFRHDTCRIKADQTFKFHDIVKEKLIARGFSVEDIKEKDSNIFSGDLYAKIDLTRHSGKLYKDCSAKVSIMSSKSGRRRQNDERMYSKQSKRSFPRVTFSGDERCYRAIKDAFVHIPSCLKN